MSASTSPAPRAADDDTAWANVRSAWRFPPGVTYLNHGSFGPPPLAVQQARREWQQRLDDQPQNFFTRQYEPALAEARSALAQFLGTQSHNLAFVENATSGMNAIAYNVRLNPREEVLLTDHEYGAVLRIWQRHAERNGCLPPRVVELPWPPTTSAEVVDRMFAAVRKETRWLVVSHITSATALTLPVAEICRRAKSTGLGVIIDGPHALAQLNVHLDALDCDYYAASCHKWLSAPFGSGLLYVHPRRQAMAEPHQLSWGRVHHADHPPPRPWADEFTWSGTRDPSSYLAVPAAIEFFRGLNPAAFRARARWLSEYARERVGQLTGLAPLIPVEGDWFTCMAHMPLPPVNAVALRERLWREFGIEVPIIVFRDRCHIRVSSHAYTTTADIDRLVNALRQCGAGS